MRVRCQGILRFGCSCSDIVLLSEIGWFARPTEYTREPDGRGYSRSSLRPTVATSPGCGMPNTLW